MLVKNAQLANEFVIEAINTLAAAKIPARAGFILAQNLKLISETAELYEKQRVKLVEAYAEKDSEDKPVLLDGPGGRKQVRLDQARIAEFNKEFEELLNIDTELAIKKIKLSDVGNVEISTGLLSQILWLIDEA
jgi:hypothetical protein